MPTPRRSDRGREPRRARSSIRLSRSRRRHSQPRRRSAPLPRPVRARPPSAVATPATTSTRTQPGVRRTGARRVRRPSPSRRSYARGSAPYPPCGSDMSPARRPARSPWTMSICDQVWAGYCSPSLLDHGVMCVELREWDTLRLGVCAAGAGISPGELVDAGGRLSPCRVASARPSPSLDGVARRKSASASGLIHSRASSRLAGPPPVARRMGSAPQARGADRRAGCPRVPRERLRERPWVEPDADGAGLPVERSTTCAPRCSSQRGRRRRRRTRRWSSGSPPEAFAKEVVELRGGARRRRWRGAWSRRRGRPRGRRPSPPLRRLDRGDEAGHTGSGNDEVGHASDQRGAGPARRTRGGCDRVLAGTRRAGSASR